MIWWQIALIIIGVIIFILFVIKVSTRKKGMNNSGSLIERLNRIVDTGCNKLNSGFRI